MRALVLLCFLLLPRLALADEPAIIVTVGSETRTFTRDELLGWSNATTIQVPRDVAYRVPMTYRAVPVASLLAGITLPPDTVIEAVALNGFIAQLPTDPCSTPMRTRLSLGLQSNQRITLGRHYREST